MILILVGCCANQSQSSDEGELVNKTIIQYHHSANCTGHEYIIGKVNFQIDGHDMWLLLMDDRSNKGCNKIVIHSPDCQKCSSVLDSTEDTKEETTSSYWGW
jgi:hypothetical protein